MNKKQRAENRAKRLVLHPMLSRQYSAKQRAEIREKERKILKGE